MKAMRSLRAALPVLGLLALALENAQANTYTVNTSSDNVVANACANQAANCSLRGAIAAANANPGSTIVFSINEFCPVSGCTITVLSPLPDISAPMSIGPSGFAIQRSSSASTGFRIFNVATNGTVNFSGLTIKGGNVAGNGAGIQNLNSGTVTVVNCVVRDNTASGNGGGIFNNTGTIILSNSSVLSNHAQNGGGLAGAGAIVVSGSTFSGNTVVGGTGAHTGDSGLEGRGGAIYGLSPGTVDLSNSSFVGNSATGGRPGGDGSAGGGSGEGGAIYNASTNLKLASCTIVGNSTHGGNGMPAGKGLAGGIETITAATVRSSIIALNTGNADPDVLGSFTSGGFNLIGKTDGSTGFTAATDQTGTVAAPLDPKLDPVLRDNGGPTQTVALFLGSPAIDKGTSSGLSGPLTTDQRGTGFARTFDDPSVPNATGGDGTDIGAFELQSGCSFSIAPASQNFGVSGSTGIVNITPNDSACSWTALSNSSFITVTSGSSGQGNGAVGFTVAANPNSGQRSGTMTIAAKTFTVTQDGTNCSYSIAPAAQSLDAAASTNTVNVTASAGCAWAATSNDPSFLGVSSGASGSGNGVVTYTITANSTTAKRIGTLTIAGQTFTVTQAGVQPTLLANISTRLRVETGDNVLIGGFIITGTQPKKVIVRGIGTSLPLPDKLADPTLELHGPNGLIEANDNWVDSGNKQAIIDSTIPPSSDLESAIVATLPANGTGYTAIVRGVNGGTGIGVVEAYDLDTLVDSRLANISTRGFVQTGDNVLIAGTIVVGQTSQKVIIRAIGPSLPVAGNLADPTLELRNANGDLIRANDNWRTGGQEAEIIASTVPPTHDLESAIVESLPANGASYTAIVRGVNDTSGIAVVEVYALP